STLDLRNVPIKYTHQAVNWELAEHIACEPLSRIERTEGQRVTMAVLQRQEWTSRVRRIGDCSLWQIDTCGIQVSKFRIGVSTSGQNLYFLHTVAKNGCTLGQFGPEVRGNAGVIPVRYMSNQYCYPSRLRMKPFTEPRPKNWGFQEYSDLRVRACRRLRT